MNRDDQPIMTCDRCGHAWPDNSGYGRWVEGVNPLWLCTTCAQERADRRKPHTTNVVAGFQPCIGGKVTFTPSCSCGWTGTTWESRELAQASANGHFAFPTTI